MTGGNEARLAFLANLQTVKLVGRSSLEDEELETLQALLEHRKARGSKNSIASVLIASPTPPPVQAPPQQSRPPQGQPQSRGSGGATHFRALHNALQRYPPLPNRFKQSLSTLPKEY